jgi:hypothetical protein
MAYPRHALQSVEIPAVTQIPGPRTGCGGSAAPPAMIITFLKTPQKKKKKKKKKKRKETESPLAEFVASISDNFVVLGPTWRSFRLSLVLFFV